MSHRTQAAGRLLACLFACLAATVALAVDTAAPTGTPAPAQPAVVATPTVNPQEPAKPAEPPPLAAPSEEPIVADPNAPAAPTGMKDGMQKLAQENARTAPMNYDGPPVRLGDLWHRIRSGFQLQDMDNPAIRQHEEWYASRPDYIRRFVERGSKYLFHIVEEVEKRNMPTEVALLPIIESAFVATAKSSASASGIWQFIPSTGKHYGLNQTFWYDNRRDIVAATNAALDYLQKLHRDFNSWELAFAAYNCGEGCVGRAIAANQRAGLPTDFNSLNLPNETKNYVPKLMAVKNIVSSPATYAIELTDVPNEPYFARIAVPKMDVKLAAQFAGMSVEDFIALNPAFNKPVVLNDHGHILLPRDKVDEFQLNLTRYTNPLVNWFQYHAKRGESVTAIAGRYGISAAQLKAQNGIRERKGKLLHAQTLLIPGRGASDTRLMQATYEPAATSVARTAGAQPVATPTHHKVRAGDNLSSIARRYGTSASQLQAWNNLSGSAIRPGQNLVVGYRTQTVAAQPVATPVKHTPAAKSTASAPAAPAQYKVKSGDTLSGIADRFGVGTSQLARLNRMSVSSKLSVGRTLRLR